MGNILQSRHPSLNHSESDKLSSARTKGSKKKTRDGDREDSKHCWHTEKEGNSKGKFNKFVPTRIKQLCGNDKMQNRPKQPGKLCKLWNFIGTVWYILKLVFNPLKLVFNPLRAILQYLSITQGQMNLLLIVLLLVFAFSIHQDTVSMHNNSVKIQKETQKDVKEVKELLIKQDEEGQKTVTIASAVLARLESMAKVTMKGAASVAEGASKLAGGAAKLAGEAAQFAGKTFQSLTSWWMIGPGSDSHDNLNA